jgi:hypothetical protein
MVPTMVAVTRVEVEKSARPSALEIFVVALAIEDLTE